LQQDLCTITKYDTLDGPAGIQLYDENLKEQSPESEEENEIDNPNCVLLTIVYFHRPAYST